MSFYVTLPSHANKSEFPSSQANALKIPLLHPLHLPGSSWQVGLASISLPDARADANEDDIVMTGRWSERNPGKTGLELGFVDAMEICASEFEKDSTVIDGVSLMTALVNRYDRKRLSSVVQGSDLQNANGKICSSPSISLN